VKECKIYAFKNCHWVSSRTQIIYDCGLDERKKERKKARKKERKKEKERTWRNLVTEDGWSYMDEGTLLPK